MASGDLFSARERQEIDRAIRQAETSCRYEISVFVGTADEESHPFASRLHASLTAPDRSILIMVDPTARLLEIVTGSQVRRDLSDREVELVLLDMQSCFAADDLVGGLKRGIGMLAEHARPQRTLHTESV
ncbi:TPM domain-containing protein [Nocardioides donggukensis]|uniref:DUF5130 family protein n=1 Tax=Nocardioides donggukensis TaxID=2774019 RepID=A0A927K274_9ACTN|nr:TPM domain-containing protein [Nocardioides donggukensis]MBD8868899.1 DUF5130 family protein [Nocardioides donggukensis]